MSFVDFQSVRLAELNTIQLLTASIAYCVAEDMATTTRVAHQTDRGVRLFIAGKRETGFETKVKN